MPKGSRGGSGADVTSLPKVRVIEYASRSRSKRNGLTKNPTAASALKNHVMYNVIISKCWGEVPSSVDGKCWSVIGEIWARPRKSDLDGPAAAVEQICAAQISNSLVARVVICQE